jgi:hypothetical protein
LTRYYREVRRLAALVAVMLGTIASCGSPSRDLLSRPYDAGADGPDAEPPGPEDAGPDADPTLGGPCVDDTQCDDEIACTFDRCDPSLKRCRNTPDDSLCQDDSYCNGRERCKLGLGCVPGPVVTCQDGNACTIDRCVETTKSCEHAQRDSDGDGDPDDHCVAKADCNDQDPLVSSKVSEVCGNGKDDNCDGRIDEQPCVAPQHDTCASPLAITAPGTYRLSTAGAKRDYSPTCTQFVATRDVVAAVTVPPGANKDLDVWATIGGQGVGVAIQGTCGQNASEIACGGPDKTPVARARARNVAPGTYYVVVSTLGEVNVDLQVDFLTPSPRASNETCANATTLTPDVPVTAELIDAAADLASACGVPIGELTYQFSLAQARDVKLFASKLRGLGDPIVGLRAPACAAANDELRCRVGTALPVFARSLAPGTYFVTVSASSPMDVSLLLETYPPTATPNDQSCATAPAAVVNGDESIDLRDHEDAIKDGCSSGMVNAARALTLTQISDVMVIGRFSLNVLGAVSLDGPGCTMGSMITCGNGPTPQRISRRAMAPGDYRIVMADPIGQVDKLTTLVRPTTPPTNVSGADTCASAVTIPQTGGYFVGDTSGMTGDFSNQCDAPFTAPGGAPDQVLRLDLPAPKRVVFNMDGSTYSTILDVRAGPTCPGQPVQDACYVGFSGPRSFLDLQLAAGTYWIIVDGYNNERGTWALDVRVLP